MKQATLSGAGFVTLAVVAAMTASLLASAGSARAMPQFAKETGKPCTQCHQSANGTGGLTEFGQQFKANGNKLPK